MADEFPSKPIEVVIHSSYGGGTDTTARMMMIRSRRNLENRHVRGFQARRIRRDSARLRALQAGRTVYTIMALTQTHLYTMAQGKSDMKIDGQSSALRAPWTIRHSSLSARTAPIRRSTIW